MNTVTDSELDRRIEEKLAAYLAPELLQPQPKPKKKKKKSAKKKKAKTKVPYLNPGPLRTSVISVESKVTDDDLAR